MGSHNDWLNCSVNRPDWTGRPFIGYTIFSDSSLDPQESRNFYVFDLATVPQSEQIVAAQFRVELSAAGYHSLAPSETIEFVDVETPITALIDCPGPVPDRTIFDDLGSGAVYGSVTVTEDDEQTFLNIDLNETAVARLNEAADGMFAIGGHLETIDTSYNRHSLFFNEPVAPPGPVRELILTTRGCTPVPEDLVSWWSGDGHWQDIEGTNDGGRVGNITFVAGKVDDAFRFDGDGDLIQVPDDPSLKPGISSFTIDFWVRTSESGYQVFLNKGGTTTGSGGLIRFYTGQSGSDKIWYALGDGDGHNIASEGRNSGPIQRRKVPSHCRNRRWPESIIYALCRWSKRLCKFFSGPQFYRPEWSPVFWRSGKRISRWVHERRIG